MILKGLERPRRQVEQKLSKSCKPNSSADHPGRVAGACRDRASPIKRLCKLVLAPKPSLNFVDLLLSVQACLVDVDRGSLTDL